MFDQRLNYIKFASVYQEKVPE